MDSYYGYDPNCIRPGQFDPWNLMVKEKYGEDIHMDLYSKFLEKRIIFCQGPIMPLTAAIIVPQIYWLDQEDPKTPIELWINGPGGHVSEGLAIIDAIARARAEVHTVVQGVAASMSAVIALMGDRRLAFKNSQIMLHQVSSSTQGKVVDQQVSLDQSLHLQKVLFENIARKTKLGDVKEVQEFLRYTDRWFDVSQAFTAGLIDTIISSAE